ncbi:MAG: ATP cone domain-containing protein [Candidatus Nanoarchaeia archaeon]|jgi:transcriptional regulator NrdR family protein|nr:ATP cone domain-containing protein [Candidatus Nanoarchaeia archaeon]|tara:strand:- start:12290 stop:12568 length:279 start_codon:yes stop_codon:yes gene_type:complete
MQVIVKRKGHNEKFDERKVYGSIYAACASSHYSEQRCERVAGELCKKVKSFIKNKKIVKSLELRKKIEAELKKKNKELAFFYEMHLPDLKKL